MKLNECSLIDRIPFVFRQVYKSILFSSFDFDSLVAYASLELSVAKVDLEKWILLASTFQLLGLQPCTTKPGSC